MDADPGQQLITVVRKGSRAAQQLPASPDAFVWLLRREQMVARIPGGAAGAAVVDVAPAAGRLSHHGAHRMSSGPTRCSAPTGRCMTCGIRRGTPMSRDPALPLADVQWIWGMRT